MTGSHFSIILLPTLGCNADCEYCFENKADHHLSLDHLAVLIEKVMDFLVRKHIERLSIYWQGGEVMTLPPEWFEQAHSIIRRSAEARRKEVVHYLQSNMIGYSRKWNKVIREMFGNSVGSSMDVPNLHRKIKDGVPEEYERLWIRKVREARACGIKVSVIAIPNDQTLQIGAERLYSYFVDELGISDVQVNTPFPGGSSNQVKDGYPLDAERLGRFLLDLARVWLDRGFGNGVQVGHFIIVRLASASCGKPGMGGGVPEIVHDAGRFPVIWRRPGLCSTGLRGRLPLSARRPRRSCPECGCP